MSVLLPIPWRGEGVSRFILGTAQLGMNYGIANVRGRPDAANARAIVETAWKAGIRHFDTAQAYGDSESVLGTALREMGVASEAHMASKIALPTDSLDLAEISASIERSCERLGVERLWCLMLHHPSGLDHWEHGLGDTLLRHHAEGRIQHLGVSLSSLQDAPHCLAHPDMEILQLPCNAWDRRPSRLGILDAAGRNGQLCCVRSVYLQGLLALSPAAVSERLPMAHEASRRWHAFASEKGLSPTELAIRFALTLDAPLVIGAETPEQVRETAELVRQDPLPEELVDELDTALAPALEDEILEPWRWPSG